MKPPQAQSGFSLIELLIVLLITALLVGQAFPAFASALKRNRAMTVAYGLVGLEQYARTIAIGRATPVTLCGSTGKRQCDNNWSANILVFVDQNGNGWVDRDDTILRVSSELRKGETLSWHSFRNKSYLQLEPYGTTYYQNGNFTYCPSNRDAHYSIHWILNTTGHLRIADDRNGNGIPEGADGLDIRC